MAFTEIEIARIKRLVGGLCERRVPPAIRREVRLEYSVQRHDVDVPRVAGEKTPRRRRRRDFGCLAVACQAHAWAAPPPWEHRAPVE